jgi:hypothetical protein
MFVAFSCRGRCVCPSCHEKRALEKAGWVCEHVCAEVPHRQFVFTIPKRLRLYFRYDRSLLGALCQAAWRTVRTVYQATSDDLLPGPKRNFQIFDPLDFPAEVTQHIPETGDHLIRYYGWYSNKKRGQRAKRQPPAPEDEAAAPRPPSAREARKRWAALIKQVYETDPLACPKCGSEMKIIAFIERRQTQVVEKILRHCGLWEEAPARDPPSVPEPAVR